MHSLTAVRMPQIPRVGDGDSTPLFEKLVAERVAAGKQDPRSSFGSGRCFCDWVGHKVYGNMEGKDGRIGRTPHP